MADHPSDKRRWVWWSIPIVAATICFLPTLFDPLAINSDDVIVSLQAKHILHGEISLSLWGVSYQGVVYPLLYAAVFLFTGSSPLVSLLIPLLAFIALGCLTMALLRRHLPIASAAVLSILAVVIPQGWGIYFNAFRLVGVDLILLTILLLDSAPRSKQPRLRMFVGALLIALVLYTDLYFLIFLPGMVLFGFCCCFDGTPIRISRSRLKTYAAGLCTAVGSLWLLRKVAGQTSNVGVVSLDRNFHRLGECFRFAIGQHTYVAQGFNLPSLWHPPMIVAALQTIAAIGLIAGIAIGGILIFDRGRPLELRRRAVFALATCGTSVAIFLMSPMVSDIWSARYLMSFTITAPLAIALLVVRWPTKWVIAAVLPIALMGAIDGYITFGDRLDGPYRGDGTSLAQDIQSVRQLLLDNDIHGAVAAYWTSYRLTYLFDEAIVVVPADARQDRYPPYRDRLSGHRIAVIVDRNNPADAQVPLMFHSDNASSGPVTVHCGRFDVLMAPAHKS